MAGQADEHFAQQHQSLFYLYILPDPWVTRDYLSGFSILAGDKQTPAPTGSSYHLGIINNRQRIACYQGLSLDTLRD